MRRGDRTRMQEGDTELLKVTENGRAGWMHLCLDNACDKGGSAKATDGGSE